MKKNLVMYLSVSSALLLGSFATATSQTITMGGANPKSVQTPLSVSQQDWPVYGGQLANDHYSSLAQIDKTNVGQLKIAWTYDSQEQGGLQTSPLVVGRVIYAYTPSQKVIALDGASGKLLWIFDSGIKG